MENFKITLFDKMGKSMASTHFHSSYEIYYLLEGERDFFIKNRTHKVRAGDLVFINPKAIHRTKVTKSLYVKRYAMLIPKDFVQRFALDYDDNLFECFINPNPVIHLKEDQHLHLLNLFTRIYEEFESENPHKNFILTVLVTELLYYLNRYHGGDHSLPIDQTTSLSQQAIEYILENYTEQITLDELSSNLYISTYQLCRTFKAETGFTVMEYLTFVRLRESMQLLDTTNQSVTEIGFAAGFNNINHFIRTFRQHLGTTPKQYQLKRR